MGNDKLVVGNGKGLSISNTSSSQYFSNGNLVSLHNILHVPTTTQNLLSVSQLTKDNDCYFVFTSSGFYSKENKLGKILFHGVTSNGLYLLYLNQCIKNKSTSPSAFSSTRVSRNLWHHRLGHPSHQILQLATSLSIHGTSKIDYVCIACQMGKRSRLPFQPSISISSFSLDLVHSDVWGYPPTSSFSGARFSVTFIDDFSRYCWFFLLQSKSQVFDVFLNFKLSSLHTL